MCWFVGLSSLQCFTSGTWINYLYAATGDLPECMEVQPRETPWTVPDIRHGGITVRPCYCH